MMNDLRFAAHEPVNALFVLVSKIASVKPSRLDIFGSQFRILPIAGGHTSSADNHFTDFSGFRDRAAGIIDQRNFHAGDRSADRTDCFFAVRRIHAVNLELSHPATFRDFEAKHSIEPLLDGDRNCFAGGETETERANAVLAGFRAVQEVVVKFWEAIRLRRLIDLDRFENQAWLKMRHQDASRARAVKWQNLGTKPD